MKFSGIGVSPGVAVARIHTVKRTVLDEPIPGSSVEVLTALNQVADDLEHRSEVVKLDVAREVLSAQAMIARDPSLFEAIAEQLADEHQFSDVREGITAAFSGFRSALESLGGYFAERVADLDEIHDRLISTLRNEVQNGLVLTSPSVVVAEDLTPADTAALDLDFALALVVEKGGPTSHTAIVARGLGIPAIVGCKDVMQIPSGSEVVVDGRSGTLILDPSVEEIEQFFAAEESMQARAASVSGPGRLADGTAVTLLANAGNLQDAKSAREVGADGIGLFRTELLFLNRESEPTVDEQVQLYLDVFNEMAGKRVVLRTLDAGSDKPVPFINAIHEENPALGVRGWRLTRTADDVLNRQLDAIGIAAKQTSAEVWVMAPMIDTPQEAADFAARARSRGLNNVGVMVETPAAAILADKVLAQVDFASLGTNDLTQYVMAADRLDSRLSDLTSSWHPAVLRTIALAANASANLERPIGVCGESAANPILAAVLLGLGVTSLSMSPTALAEVRGYLAQQDLVTCRNAAERVLDASSAEEAQDIAINMLGR